MVPKAEERFLFLTASLHSVLSLRGICGSRGSSYRSLITGLGLGSPAPGAAPKRKLLPVVWPASPKAVLVVEIKRQIPKLFGRNCNINSQFTLFTFCPNWDQHKLHHQKRPIKAAHSNFCLNTTTKLAVGKRQLIFSWFVAIYHLSSWNLLLIFFLSSFFSSLQTWSRPSFSLTLNLKQKQPNSQGKLSLLQYVDLIYSNRAFLPDTINCL